MTRIRRGLLTDKEARISIWFEERMISEIRGLCCFADCREKATQIASGVGEDRDPDVYCDEHAEVISTQNTPVTVADCPNCHCAFGVWP